MKKNKVVITGEVAELINALSFLYEMSPERLILDFMALEVNRYPDLYIESKATIIRLNEETPLNRGF